MRKKCFDKFGVMIDMSRNAVMKPEALKRYLLILKKFGYNCVMLYTEDTYEVNENPYFGYMRGRYSKEEMKEIDSYAESIGMEIIPCVQTLAHLNAYIRWGKTPIDCNDILLTDDDKTYKLIDKMFETLSQCFKSRLIHIGMDEAHMLGRGRHLDIHGYETSTSIMKRHLAKVSEIAKKYGYTPMVWSDMFFRSWNNGTYYIEKQELPDDVVSAFPKDVLPVYWDYYHNDKKQYDDMFFNHRQLSENIWFAGGIWCWGGLVPFNKISLSNMLPAIKSCRENNIRNVFMTLWGDDGAECSPFSALPALLHVIEYAEGNEDESKIKAKFKKIIGLDYDDFMKIDLPNQISESDKVVNPSKYMLYSDPFLGFLDYTVKAGDGRIFEDYAEELYAVSEKSRAYGYLFRTEAKLCELLSIKYDLGVRTREAYVNDDKETLAKLISDYEAAIKKLSEFHKEFSKMWHRDKKPHGFDVQELRIGGIKLRMESCKNRLKNFLSGKITRIEELEEKILPYGNTEGAPRYVNSYKHYASVNVISL